MADHKYIQNPAQYLVDNGLLFAINQNVLHPLGLALELQSTEAVISPEVALVRIVDATQSTDELVYGEETFKMGNSKIDKFMQAYGKKKIRQREKKLGYITQPAPDSNLLKNGTIPLIAIKDPTDPNSVRVKFLVSAKWLNAATQQWYDMAIMHFLEWADVEEINHIYQIAKEEGQILLQKKINPGEEDDDLVAPPPTEGQ